MTTNNTSTSSALSNVTEITVDNANMVLSQLLSLPSDTIDLSAITHCDSTGIAVLLETKKKLSEQKHQTVFINATQQLHDLATFLKVDNLLFEQ